MFLYYYKYFDVFTELFTPDPKAIIAATIGLVAGILGCFLRFGLRKEKDKLNFFRDGDLVPYLVWPGFGALAATTLNTFPVISFILGMFAPTFYKLLEEMIKADPSRFIPFLKKKD